MVELALENHREENRKPKEKKKILFLDQDHMILNLVSSEQLLLLLLSTRGNLEVQSPLEDLLRVLVLQHITQVFIT